MAKKTALFVATTSTIIATLVYVGIKFLLDSGFNWLDIPIFAVLFWVAVFVSWKYF